MTKLMFAIWAVKYLYYPKYAALQQLYLATAVVVDWPFFPNKTMCIPNTLTSFKEAMTIFTFLITWHWAAQVIFTLPHGGKGSFYPILRLPLLLIIWWNQTKLRWFGHTISSQMLFVLPACYCRQVIVEVPNRNGMPFFKKKAPYRRT